MVVKSANGQLNFTFWVPSWTTNHSELAKFLFVLRQVLVGECFLAALVCAHVLHALNQHLCGQVQFPWTLYRRGSSAIICWQTRWPLGREAIGLFVEMHRHMEHLTIAISLSYLALNVISAIFALSLWQKQGFRRTG